MAQRAPAPRDEIIWLCPAPAGAPKAVGWIGGRPHLPEGKTWPTTGGVPAGFLAQIDLAALPHGLWRGYGPRQGWLCLFLDHDGEPRLVHSARHGPEASAPDRPALRWQAETDAPRWDLVADTGTRTGSRAPATPAPRPDFDLGHPGCQPVDMATARALLTALHTELDRSSSFLDALEAAPRDLPPRDAPGSNGIWGRLLRGKPQPVPEAPRLANPGILLSGRRDIAAARAVLVRLEDALDRAGQAALPPEALPLLCAAIGHVDLPLFLTEAAPDIAAAPGAPAPIRIYQRNVPATASAWGARGTPRSRWAETWHEDLARRARAMLTQTPERMPPQARAFWAAQVAREAQAAPCILGGVQPMPEGDLAVLLRLPNTVLTGWNWGVEALEICLPLAALAEGDFSQALALWREDQPQ